LFHPLWNCDYERTSTEVRGTAFAMVNIMDDLGKGLGPMIFAAIARGVGRPWVRTATVSS